MGVPEGPYRIDSGTCNVCGREGPLQVAQAPLGGPGSYGWCDECDRHNALPADYVELRMGPEWSNEGEMRFAIGQAKWAGWTVWVDGRYVPLDEYLEPKIALGRRIREQREADRRRFRD